MTEAKSHDPTPASGEYFALKSTCQTCGDTIYWQLVAGEWEHFDAEHGVTRDA